MIKTTKLFNIVNSENKAIGVIQFEKYDTMELYGVNTKSIGISFKTLPEAIQYIEKFGHKTTFDEVTPSGYNLKNIRMNVMEQLGDYEENFETIYKALLAYTIDKGFLKYPENEYLSIKDVFTTALNILNDELDKQYIMCPNVSKKFLNDDVAFDLQDSSYKLNEKYLANTFYRIIDNAVDDITIRIR